MTDKTNILFYLQNVTKKYGSTVALDNISLKIESGCIISIYGPNGAGKSTLVKILCGVEQANSGKLKFRNSELSFDSYTDALRAGVAYMPQDFGLIPNLTGWENIEVAKNKLNNLFWYNVKPDIIEDDAIQNFLNIDLTFFNRQVSELTNYQKQILAIYKAFSFGSSIYIFDESTTDLSSNDFQKFADLLVKLKNRGISILFISHKIDEVFSISDEIIVLRNGKLILQESTTLANKTTIIQMFISDSNQVTPKKVQTYSLPPYQIKHLINDNLELDFELNRGETKTINTGDTSLDQHIGYTLYKILKLNSNIQVGIIPGNRKAEGIYPNLSIKDNLLANAQQHLGQTIVQKEDLHRVNTIAKQLDLKYENWHQSINELSGGNQQKIVFGRWMIADFDILILIEPTSGVDLKSKTIIHNTILEMNNEGKSFILITSDEGERIKLNAKTIGVKELC